jgi:DNA modification methylase
MNKLYYGDNLEVLRDKIPDKSVDLIYLDPPFQSGKNYNVISEPKNKPLYNCQRLCQRLRRK